MNDLNKQTNLKNRSYFERTDFPKDFEKQSFFTERSILLIYRSVRKQTK